VRIALERHSSKAVYLQIRDRIRQLIQTRACNPETNFLNPLPAESTRVNKLTVIEAYNVLEADGLVEARQFWTFRQSSYDSPV